MLALLQLIALCGVSDTTPGYTIHLREKTTPERVMRMTLRDADTVLDAVASLEEKACDLGRMDLWLVRAGAGDKVQVLPIDWTGLTMQGLTATNYVLSDGDRLFLQTRVELPKTKVAN